MDGRNKKLYCATVRLVPFDKDINYKDKIIPLDLSLGRFKLLNQSYRKRKLTIDISKTPKDSKNYDFDDLFKPKINRRLEKEKALVFKYLEKYRKEKNTNIYTGDNNGISSKYFKSQDLSNELSSIENFYFQMKTKYYGVLLFFEYGANYICFDADAKLIAQALDIKLTKFESFVSVFFPATQIISKIIFLFTRFRKKIGIFNQSYHSSDTDMPNWTLYSIYMPSTFITEPLFSNLNNGLNFFNTNGGSCLFVSQNYGKITFLTINFYEAYFKIVFFESTPSGASYQLEETFSQYLNENEVIDILIFAPINQRIENFFYHYQNIKKKQLGKVINIDNVVNRFSFTELESCCQFLQNHISNLGLIQCRDNLTTWLTKQNLSKDGLNDSKANLIHLIAGVLSHFEENGFLDIPQAFLTLLSIHIEGVVSNKPISSSKTRSCTLNSSAIEICEIIYEKMFHDHLATQGAKRKMRHWLLNPLQSLPALEERLEIVCEIVNLPTEDLTYREKECIFDHYTRFTQGLLNINLQQSDCHLSLETSKLNNLILHKSCKPSQFRDLLIEIFALQKLVKVLECLPNFEEIKRFKSPFLTQIIGEMIYLINSIATDLKETFIMTGLLSLEAIKNFDIENIFNLPSGHKTKIFSSFSELITNEIPRLMEQRFLKFEILAKLKSSIQNHLDLNKPRDPVWVLVNNDETLIGDLDESFHANANRNCLFSNLCLQVSKQNDNTSVWTPPCGQNLKNDWDLVTSMKQCYRIKNSVLRDFDHQLNTWNDSYTKLFLEAWTKFLDCFNCLCFTDLDKMIDHVTTLNCYLALAKVSSQPHYNKPFFIQHGNILHIESSYHPIRLLNDPTSCTTVKNDLFMDSDSRRCIILTGPNGSGKTFYLQQICINVILAQVGCYVPAERYLSGLFDSILTKFRPLGEDIMQNSSIANVEINDLSLILNNCSSRSLVLIDDFGNSTSILDVQALSYSTLVHLIVKVECLTIFCTYFPCIVQLGQIEYPLFVVNCHMATICEENYVPDDNKDTSSPETSHVSFMYKCIDGVCLNTFTMNYATLKGLKKEITLRAHDIATEKQILDNLNDTLVKEVKKLFY